MWSINRGLQKTSYISKNKVKIEKRCKQNSLVFGKLNRCCRIQWIHWLQATKRETVLTVKNIRNWIRWHVPRMWYADTWSAKRLSEEKMSTKMSPSHCMSAYVLICYLLSLILICYFDQSIPMGLSGTAHIEKLDFHDNDWVMPTCTSICQNKHSY